jgi:acetyl-CoA carboxylase biotin carboxyl carrier protein
VDLKEIKELIELVAEKRLAEFEMEKGGFKLRIRHAAGAPAAAATDTLTSPAAVSAAPLPVAKSEHSARSETQPVVSTQPEAKPDKKLHIIKAPIVGTFYRAPNPTSDPFVSTGSLISPGTVLCIIEAMKLMNEIESDVKGEVAEIFIENGQSVEYGQPLFGIKTE